MVIADWTEDAGKALESELNSPNTIFHKTDISNWDSVLELFQATFTKFGCIDVVLANAGTNAWDNLLAEEFDSAGKLKAPTMRLMEVNLYGPIYTVKAAVHYFAKHPDKKPCQIIMTGSVASLFDGPPLYLYCASKAGVLGLLRGMRTQMPKQNMTINMVAPWMTVTPMLPKAIEDMWDGLPANSAEGPARALLIPAIRHDINGETLFVAGNRAYALEEKLHETQPLWLGDQLSKHFDEGQRRLIPAEGTPAFDSVDKERKAAALKG